MTTITREKRKKRIYIGKFYYRGNGGESGSDVFRRVEEFKKKFFDEIEFGKKYYKNIVLVSHACFFRAFAMNILHFPIDTFHRMAKPRNCAIWVFEKKKDKFTPMIEEVYKILNEIEYYKY